MIHFICLSALLVAQPDDAILRVRATKDNGHEVVAKLPADFAAKLAAGKMLQEDGQAVLTLALVNDKTNKAGSAMLGKYERKGNELTLTPRFALGAGQTYRVEFHHPQKLITYDYKVPAAEAKTPPKVVKIYPTADVLPANHLKFYIYFDRPMRGGKELFEKIVLVDDKGKEIDDAWLIDEIWDEENNCLIIYIHPGRIKWGVELRELMGPVLFEKREYSLVIRGALTDRDGNKVGKDIVKKFRTTPEDRVRIELADWKLSQPAAKSNEPLKLTLPKIIDHRSLQRFVSVHDARGQQVEGKIEIGKDETFWTFTPYADWRLGDYYVQVHADLEDVAGNTPNRPFDLDLTAPKQAEQKLRLDFRTK